MLLNYAIRTPPGPYWLLIFEIHGHHCQAEEKPKNNLGDLARKMRLELELGEKKKREQEAVNAKKDQEEKVVKDAEMAEEVANQQVTYCQLEVFQGYNDPVKFIKSNSFGHQVVSFDEFVECTISFSLTSEHLRQPDTSDSRAIQPTISEV